MITANLTGPLSIPDRLKELFWKKVDTSDSCWVWTASTLKSNGRGQFPTARRYGFSTSPYRFSWQLHHGAIPSGRLICHRCDNPLCVRPEHLFLGTQLDNMEDARKKGRTAQGERNPRSTCNEEMIQEIRNFPGTHQEAADHFKVPKRRVISYRRGESWKHLGLTPINGNRRGESSFNCKLSSVQYLEIYNDRATSIDQLAKRYGVSDSLIKRIRRGSTRRIKELLNDAHDL